MRRLGRANGCRARLSDLPRLLGWPAERAAEAVAELHGGDWVVIAGKPPLARLTPWARVWATERIRRHRTVADPDRFIDDRYLPGGAPLGILTGCATAWRELHRYGCRCETCKGAVPSATRPRPAVCSACKGKPLPPLWECLRCGRGGRDRMLRPLPRPVVTAVRDDDGLKGGTG